MAERAKRKKKGDELFGLKLLISVIYDVVDIVVIIPNAATLGVAGTAYDLIGGVLGYYLFGPVGLINLWELGDLTNTVEIFPTMTAVAIYTKIK